MQTLWRAYWKAWSWREYAAVATLVVACAVAYHNSFGGEFVYDDFGSITQNGSIRSLWRLDRVLCPPAGVWTTSGRPILNLSIALNWAFHTDDVVGYHVVNLLIHLSVTILLFSLLRRTCLLPRMPEAFARAATPLALAASLLWALHPLQTESVTYIVQRAESIVAFFYLLTLYCALRAATTNRPERWATGAVVACLLGMASKEVMVSAPLVVLLYDRAFLAGSFRQAWRLRKRLYWHLAATWLLLAALMGTTAGRGGTAGFGVAGGAGTPPGVTVWQYARSEFGVVAHYLRLAFWPDQFCISYWWPVTDSPAHILPPALLILALLAATVAALVYRPRWGVPAALFFLVLAPTSSIIPVNDLAFEHRMYLPLAGLVVLVVFGGFALLERLAGRSRAAWWAGAFLVCVLAAALTARTVRRNRDYQSMVALWGDALVLAPHNTWAHLNLGLALVRDGRIDQGIQHYKEAIRLDPEFSKPCNNLANAYARTVGLALAKATRDPSPAELAWMKDRLTEALRLNAAAARKPPKLDGLDTNRKFMEDLLARVTAIEARVAPPTPEP